MSKAMAKAVDQLTGTNALIYGQQLLLAVVMGAGYEAAEVHAVVRVYIKGMYIMAIL